MPADHEDAVHPARGTPHRRGKWHAAAGLAVWVSLIPMIACGEDPRAPGPLPLPVMTTPALVPAPEPAKPEVAPAAAAPAPPDPLTENGMVDVFVRAGSIKVGNKTRSYDELTAIFERIAERSPNMQILIRVVGKVSKQRVRSIQRAAEGAGLSRIGTFDAGPDRPKRKKKRRRR